VVVADGVVAMLVQWWCYCDVGGSAVVVVVLL
jgi:hypothetical protein